MSGFGESILPAGIIGVFLGFLFWKLRPGGRRSR